MLIAKSQSMLVAKPSVTVKLIFRVPEVGLVAMFWKPMLWIAAS